MAGGKGGGGWPSFVQIVNGYPTIDIGRMRHSITIQKQQAASPPVIDASGIVLSWQPFLPVIVSPPDFLMAAIEIMRGTEVIRGGQTTAQLFLTVGMWYSAGILPSMRVLSDNGAVYVIQSVDNVLELNVVLLLNCLALGPNDK